ncbi:polysaccharide deacetylase family protein [Halosolutus gelatinilyticus]|uniref:polysaccharide deacetylase family protein n=1 Tax=Halosolutus gelatinilyticus TaxID=2931975 RepID=UPI001FF1EAAB|nr:polysaccharide deacetylase family protein [Halosolutus gelatinilyticus]
MYHSVGGGFYDDVSPGRFRRQLEQLTRKYDVVDLPAVLEETADTRVALTFDDGTVDFYETVRPMLQEFDVPATVFVVADSIGNAEFLQDEWFDYEYMTEAQLVDLADDELVTIGNHSKSHRKLDTLSAGELETEIAESKLELEERLGIDVDRFCYPQGEYSATAVDLVRDTHRFAVAGLNEIRVGPESDPCLLPRINGAGEPKQLRWEFTDCSAFLAGTMFDLQNGHR